MKQFWRTLWALLLPAICLMSSQGLFLVSGCANIVAPLGGAKDSLPPFLVNATPRDSATDFNVRKIQLNFNEFIQLDNITENLIISPTPKRNPEVTSKLRTLTITLKDTPEPNTTYTYDFGKGIKDVNEGNILKNFQFRFSTGKELANGTLSGKVVLAADGKVDTTLFALLYRNSRDSAVFYEKPRYVTRLDNKGFFTFRSLPRDTFYLYALKDEGGSRRYLSPAQLFAFADAPVVISDTTASTLLYAYVQEAREEKKTTEAVSPIKKGDDKKLRVDNNIANGEADLLKPLEFYFRQAPLKIFDTTKLLFTDESFKPLSNYRWVKDTSNRKVSLLYKWQENTGYNIIVSNGFAVDTQGREWNKTDTLNFRTRRASAYGSIRLRITNLNPDKHPILQFVTNGEVTAAYPLTGKSFYLPLFPPGDYELRILFDANRNGRWDPGDFFGTKKQPEIVNTISQKLTIKPNWDNEADITL